MFNTHPLYFYTYLNIFLLLPDRLEFSYRLYPRSGWRDEALLYSGRSSKPLEEVIFISGVTSFLRNLPAYGVRFLRYFNPSLNYFILLPDALEFSYRIYPRSGRRDKAFLYSRRRIEPVEEEIFIFRATPFLSISLYAANRTPKLNLIMLVPCQQSVIDQHIDMIYLRNGINVYTIEKFGAGDQKLAMAVASNGVEVKKYPAA